MVFVQITRHKFTLHKDSEIQRMVLHVFLKITIHKRNDTWYPLAL